MNKSLKMDIMRIRAKKKIEKIMKQHQEAWHGKPAKEPSDGVRRP